MEVPLINDGKVVVAYSLMYDDQRFLGALAGFPDIVDELAAEICGRGLGPSAYNDETSRRAVMFAQFLAARSGRNVTEAQIRNLVGIVNAAIANDRRNVRSPQDFARILGNSPPVPNEPFVPRGPLDTSIFRRTCETYFRGCYRWESGAHPVFADWLKAFPQGRFEDNKFPAIPQDTVMNCWEFVIYVLVAARKLHPLDVAGAYRALIDKAANKADKQALGFGDTVVQMFKDRVNVLKADVKRRDEVAFLDVPVADGRIDQKLILMPYDVLLLPGDPADIGNSTINHAVLVIDNMPAGGNWETVKVVQLWSWSGNFADFSTIKKVLKGAKGFTLVRL